MNPFACTFQYTTGALMNTHYIHSLHDGSSSILCKINGNFTSLVWMTFICTWANCISELAYFMQFSGKNYQLLYLKLYFSILCCVWKDQTIVQLWGTSIHSITDNVVVSYSLIPILYNISAHNTNYIHVHQHYHVNNMSTDLLTMKIHFSLF